jgi:hypothetical protein
VESCTAAVEHFDGRFEIIKWTGLAPPRDETGLATEPDESQARREWSSAAGLSAAFGEETLPKPPFGRQLPIPPDAA